MGRTETPSKPAPASRRLIGALALVAAAWPTLRVRAGDDAVPPDALAANVVGPHPGARSLPAPPVEIRPEEAAKTNEWFGTELPWWRWSRLTGNWGGARPRLEESGIDFGGSVVADWSTALDGGVRHRVAGRALVEFHVTADPKPLLGIEGGQFFAQYYLRRGPDGSEDVGAIQDYSNIDDGSLTRLGELWYEQKLFGEHLRVKAGQVDANTEFAFVHAASEFINASAGFSPTLVAMPTYPEPAPSINVFVYPAEWWYAGVGVYGGTLDGRGNEVLRDPFAIGEMGVTRAGSGRWGSGRFAIGGWYKAGDQAEFDGHFRNGTSGWYALVEQQVWRKHPESKDDPQGLSLFLRYGFADEEVSPIAHHVEAGAQAVGPIPGREDDATGLMVSWVGLSDAKGAPFDRDETAVEWFYLFRVTPFFRLKPDLQWISNPGGLSANADAVVGTLRIIIDL